MDGHKKEGPRVLLQHMTIMSTYSSTVQYSMLTSDVCESPLLASRITDSEGDMVPPVNALDDRLLLIERFVDPNT